MCMTTGWCEAQCQELAANAGNRRLGAASCAPARVIVALQAVEIANGMIAVK